MIGKTISHYKILEHIGGGGMGIVYKAQDLKLDRFVALKFLPPHLTANDEEKQRFIHEAKAASSLDHNNICNIYEIDETEDGQLFISMACYEGETLDKRIKEKPLPIDESINITIQIAQGLAKAHEKEIVHRDIKPANIMLTADGVVKILDFGLAKLSTQTKLTKEGSTIGTIAYMSPEQTKGEEVDQRTDIWSLGVVLYEMVSGELPFRGDYDQAVIYSIINDKPERLSEINAKVSAEIDRIVMLCLEKNPNNRYQNINNLHTDLTNRKITAVDKQIDLWAKNRLLKFIVPLALVLLMIVVILVFRTTTSMPDKNVEPELAQITFTGNAQNAAISQDGNFIAYRTLDREKREISRLFVKELSGGEPVKIFEGNLGLRIDWSPSGIYILASGRSPSDSISHILIFHRMGGSPKRFIWYRNYCWSTNDSVFAGVEWGRDMHPKKVLFTNQFTGDTSHISLNDAIKNIVHIDWSPIGDYLLLTTFNPFELWTTSADGKLQNKLTELKNLESCGAKWSGAGDAIYFYNFKGNVSDLNKIRIDPLTGESIDEAAKIMSLSNAYYWFDIDRNNQLLVYSHRTLFGNLFLVKEALNQVDRKLNIKQLTYGTHYIQRPNLSPDGKQVAYSKSEGDISNIYTLDIAENKTKQMTFYKSNNLSPVWSPDGRQIAFTSDGSGMPQIGIIDLNTGKTKFFAETQPLIENDCPLSWAPGDEISYLFRDAPDYFLFNPKKKSHRSLAKIIGNNEVWAGGSACFSPDNRKMAVTWGKEKFGLWIFSVLDSTGFLLSEQYNEPLAWSKDGNWIYAWDRSNPQIWKISTITNESIKYFEVPDKNVYRISMNPEKGIIIYNTVEWLSDIWLIENFDSTIFDD